ncbi:MAG: hydrolase [Vampirovibrionales bacterium]|nr:hydrolase [Vampirovibrionales bacterium]
MINPSPMFTPANSVLWVVDLQDRMVPAIDKGDAVVQQAAILLQAAQLLAIPVVVSEQYPKGLGHTVEALAPWLEGAPILEKTTFGVFATEASVTVLQALQKTHLVVCGVETHVCVSQTVLQAINLGYTVGVVVDAVGSRHKADHKTALKRLEQQGAQLLTTESILFEWLGDAQHAQFKAVQALVK